MRLLNSKSIELQAVEALTAAGEPDEAASLLAELEEMCAILWPPR